MIDIERSLCYTVEVEGDEFVPESNSIFYQEVCIKGNDNIFLMLKCSLNEFIRDIFQYLKPVKKRNSGK